METCDVLSGFDYCFLAPPEGRLLEAPPEDLPPPPEGRLPPVDLGAEALGALDRPVGARAPDLLDGARAEPRDVGDRVDVEGRLAVPLGARC